MTLPSHPVALTPPWPLHHVHHQWLLAALIALRTYCPRSLAHYRVHSYGSTMPAPAYPAVGLHIVELQGGEVVDVVGHDSCINMPRVPFLRMDPWGMQWRA